VRGERREGESEGEEGVRRDGGVGEREERKDERRNGKEEDERGNGREQRERCECEKVDVHTYLPSSHVHPFSQPTHTRTHTHIRTHFRWLRHVSMTVLMDFLRESHLGLQRASKRDQERQRQREREKGTGCAHTHTHTQTHTHTRKHPHMHATDTYIHQQSCTL